MTKNRLKLLFSLILTSLLLEQQNTAQDAFNPNQPQLNVIGNSNTGLFSASDLAGIEAEKALQENYSQPTPSNSPNSNPFIISTQSMSNEVFAEIEEDMRIMARILNDTTGSSGQAPWASGIPLINYSKNRTNRDIYISGTGALFFLSVDFPLVGRTEKERIVESSPKDSTWERARRKVQGQAVHRNLSTDRIYQAYSRAQTIQPKPFNPEQVRVFKGALTEALASASNIRILKPSEQVWIVVEGTAEIYSKSRSIHSSRSLPGTQNSAYASSDSVQGSYYSLGTHSQFNHPNRQVSRLTISATKKDIDDVHDGTISMKEFLKRIEQQTQ